MLVKLVGLDRRWDYSQLAKWITLEKNNNKPVIDITIRRVRRPAFLPSVSAKGHFGENLFTDNLYT
jgi:hypothetical protein